LEKHLAKLIKQRRLNWIVHWFSNLVFFFCCFCIIWASSKSPSNGFGVILGVGMVTLFGSITQLASALSAQADIRALLSYKMLSQIPPR
jgi:hypothetical protein